MNIVILLGVIITLVTGLPVLLQILKTHPKVLMGGTVLENRHSMEPEEFLASRE